MKSKFDVIIIGGGLAGLTASILLADGGKDVLLIEKKKYPFHKVCGEYVSNEVLDFLKSIGFNPFDYGCSDIKRLRISTPSGKNIYIPLDLGGFGISRYVMDEQLLGIAVSKGVKVLQQVKVTDVRFEGDEFLVDTDDSTFTSDFVIGSYGKRDTLDKKLNRDFIQEKTGYLGVKYHIRIKYPEDEIGLDSFTNGYCGIVKIEKDLYNLCYLYKRKGSVKSIGELEREVLFRNPVLKKLFHDAEFVYEEPLVINEISFRKKSLTENYIMLCGDAAGMIPPLCGNGMSMAIQGARLLVGSMLAHSEANCITIKARQNIINNYSVAWKSMFGLRLKTGRILQQTFGNETVTAAVLNTVHAIPPLERLLVKNTHGKSF